ncbi:DUF2164 domain-containing protein [Tuberibacillus sp. Marseille-P3662]|uniref:DUF2164 domain-containing protein n=1 Tax=Tuberibacillus sp. Marseille-P3662 TaxID=1965358 RepID=UPI000A1C8263|nr:DUF2164 domain-containing protein [Tuberibacillus sp. Marseille-P3662]
MELKPYEKERIIEALKGYFYDERSEELGMIGAENLYAFILKEIGPLIYNRALNDASMVLERQMDSLIEEMLVLKKD